MKRLLLLCLTYIMCVGNHQMAAQDSSESPGIFKALTYKRTLKIKLIGGYN